MILPTRPAPIEVGAGRYFAMHIFSTRYAQFPLCGAENERIVTQEKGIGVAADGVFSNNEKT